MKTGQARMAAASCLVSPSMYYGHEILEKDVDMDMVGDMAKIKK